MPATGVSGLRNLDSAAGRRKTAQLSRIDRDGRVLDEREQPRRVWLPGLARSDAGWLTKLPEPVAAGSVALYEALLELDD
jgi:hypothetical protein